MIHRIKIKEEYAEAVWKGAKHFEIRKNDRNYQIGDIIVFSVVDCNYQYGHPIEHASYLVTYVLTAEQFPDGIKDGYCVFTIAHMDEGLGFYYSDLGGGGERMLKTERDKKICERYSQRDENGFVQCDKCPLVVDRKACMCKATCHYNRHTREWEYDTEENK